jgi:hypothetical protein
LDCQLSVVSWLDDRFGGGGFEFFSSVLIVAIWGSKTLIFIWFGLLGLWVLGG